MEEPGAAAAGAGAGLCSAHTARGWVDRVIVKGNERRWGRGRQGRLTAVWRGRGQRRTGATGEREVRREGPLL